MRMQWILGRFSPPKRPGYEARASLVAILEWSLQPHTTGDDDMCAVGVAAHAQTASRRQIIYTVFPRLDARATIYFSAA